MGCTCRQNDTVESWLKSQEDGKITRIWILEKDFCGWRNDISGRGLCPMEGEREPSILGNSRESVVFYKLIFELRTLVKHPVALKKINLFCILDTSNSSYILMISLHNWDFTRFQNRKSVLFWRRKPAINRWKGFVIPNHKLFIRSAFNKLYTTLYMVFIFPPQGHVQSKTPGSGSNY